MNKYKFYYILLLVKILILSGFVEGNITVCVPFNKNNNVEDYSTLKGNIKQELQSSENQHGTIFFEELDFDFHHPAISAKGQLKNVSISHVLDIELKLFDENSEIFHLIFHNLSIVGEYNMTGNFGDLFDIFGEGPFWLNLLNLSVAVFGQITSINKTALCVSIDTQISLEKFENWFYNLMNDDELEELINHALSSIGVEIIEIIWGEVKEQIDGPLEQWIQDILNGNSAHIFSGVIRNLIDIFASQANLISTL